MNRQEAFPSQEPIVNQEGVNSYSAFKDILLVHGVVTAPSRASAGPESDYYTYALYSTLGFPVEAAIVNMGFEGIEVRSSATLEQSPEGVIEDIKNDRRGIIVTAFGEHKAARYVIKPEGIIDATVMSARSRQTGESEYHTTPKQSIQNKMHKLRMRNSSAYRRRILRDLNETAERVLFHAVTHRPQSTA